MVELKLSLKRVQTFIFEVPRLKAMLGANALVGQVLRHELSKLLNKHGKSESLSWPPQIEGNYPAGGCYANDPLNGTADPDNPADLYSKGILARDGGHFIAAFPDESAAEEFLREAAPLLAERLPGVLYEAYINSKEVGKNSEDVRNSALEEYLLDLPVLQVCQETGQGPASDPGQKENIDWQARSVTHRYDWGGKFRRGETQDIIGLLRKNKKLYPNGSGKEPQDIENLVGDGYLALIHADGNGIGKRHDEWKEKAPKNNVAAKEAHGEAFFHSMRVAVRCALVDALEKAFSSTEGYRPYELLMLGGDDLLLACRADKALEFAQHYARALESHELADHKVLDVAIGVAIAGRTYPIHRLHDLAESLASSAKRLYRASGQSGKSVIDWQVVTQSWFEGVADARRASEWLSYTVNDKIEHLLLTGRPYFVLDDDGLKGLLSAKDKLDEDKGKQAARSPLRSLRGACEQGWRAGEMAFAGLDEPVRSVLAWPGDKLWKQYDEQSGRYFLTRALDVIDIREIDRLGSSKKND